MNREAIYSSLFDLLSNAYSWATASRVLLHWSDCDRLQQPAMFMVQAGEQAIVQTRQPTVYQMNVQVYIYAHSQTLDGENPSQILNKLLDAVTAAMKPSRAAEVQTLGGLVQYARIEGAIETDEGFLGEQAVAIVPITILTVD